MKKKLKGFTLIELLATIAILGIILSIIGIFISKSINNTAKNAKYVNETSIKKAANIYAMDFIQDSSGWYKEYNNEGIETGKEYSCTTIHALIANGLLDNNLLDPETKEPINTNKFIKISRNLETKVVQDEIFIDSIDCKFDEVEPKVKFEILSGNKKDGNEWYISNVKIKATITVGESGISPMSKFIINDESDSTNNIEKKLNKNEFEYEFDILEDSKNYSITIDGYNGVGVHFADSISVKVDKTVPTIESFGRSTTKNRYLGQTHAEGSFSDETSGITKWKITTNGKYTDDNWNDVDNTSKKTIDLRLDRQGYDDYFYLWVQDEAGNYSLKAWNGRYDMIGKFVKYSSDSDKIFIIYKDYSYDKTEGMRWKAILKDGYKYTTFSSNKCCDTGVCSYENNNFTSNYIGTNVLIPFLGTLQNYQNKLVNANWNTGYIKLKTIYTGYDGEVWELVEDQSNARTVTSYIGLPEYSDRVSIWNIDEKYNKNMLNKHYYTTTLAYNIKDLQTTYAGTLVSYDNKSCVGSHCNNRWIVWELSNQYTVYTNNNSYYRYARPAVVFRGDNIILSGSGTAEDPYIIDEN